MTQAMLRPLPERASTPALDDAPPAIGGKFFFVGDHKLYLRGVSYGPFAVSGHGFPFPDPPTLETDFRLMAELGVNCLRTFTVPPRWVLDRAAEHGMRVLITITWAERECYLHDKAVVAAIRGAVRAAGETCANHPALFGFLIGNEVPPDIVRWYGPDRVRAFLRTLRDEVKERAPAALVSYANFPSTEYLDVTDFVDFVSFNVYLHREVDFRRYLSRLQTIAEDKPLVLTEFGVDSQREGADAQAELLSWMIRAGFESGAAGTFVFSWTDDWFTGGAQIADWAFGLVDAQRRPKPAYRAVQAQYAGPLPPRLERTPRVSVVVCAYNAERTMDACLESLRTLNYPDYEVIVVNDGSTDATLAISERHKAVYDADPGGPRMVIISQENKGLSVARNVGAHAAGDDVDLCWRLQNRGYPIGFSPAATVWHYRRNTVKAYLKQQMGYGKAEALLYFKHPYRFNLLGQSRWLGRIYGELTSAVLSRRPIIYFGAFGRGLFQSMYEPPSSLLSYLPFTLEWNAIGLLLVLATLVSPSALPIAALPLAVSLVWSIATAMRARVDPRFGGLRSRALIAVLTYLGPLVRGLQRYLWRLRAHGDVEPVEFEGQQQPARVDWLRRAFTLGYLSEHGHEKEALLAGVMEFLIPRKYLIAVDPGWNRWDLEIYRGIWSKLRLTVAAKARAA